MSALKVTTQDLSPFTAAELAMERALASDEVASAQRLEAILGGNGEWTAERAYEVWVREMTNLGFGDHAHLDDAEEDDR